MYTFLSLYLIAFRLSIKSKNQSKSASSGRYILVIFVLYERYKIYFQLKCFRPCADNLSVVKYFIEAPVRLYRQGSKPKQKPAGGFKVDNKYEHPENKVSEKEKQERIEEGKLVAKAIFKLFKNQ